MSINNTNTIPVDQAVTWVTRWRESDHNLGNIKGFFIPGVDLIELLGEEGVADSRTYMAIDDDSQFHILLVAVDDSGNDMIDEAAGQYVYDFTKPCPPICSETGPLR
ncbi:MAG: hypothetical protein COA38_15725 [Fluviicola sp.]|nr:MAG: hypothetical protein COA38_15725 [Fluviicola sp.]